MPGNPDSSISVIVARPHFHLLASSTKKTRVVLHNVLLDIAVFMCDCFFFFLCFFVCAHFPFFSLPLLFDAYFPAWNEPYLDTY